MFLFMFGALVVLHPAGIVPSQSDFIWDLSAMLETTMGAWGRYLFFFIAMAAMFSTQLAVSDGHYRLWTDLLHTNFRFARRWAPNQWYLFLALTLMTISIISTWVLETFPEVSALDFFFYNAGLNGLAMALYVPLLLVINFKYLPKSAQPKPLNVLMVTIGAATYISFAVYVVWDKVSALLI
jgi:hypothetical protein